MLNDLLPLISALAAAAAVYFFRERHRRRTEVRPPMPDVTMEQVLAACAVPPEARGGLLALDPSRLSARRAALETARMALHLDAIVALGEPERALLLKGYQEGMDAALRQALAAATAQWGAVRHYLMLKYDDAVPDDWFDHYLHVAGPYVREKVRLARDFLVEVDEGAGRFAAIYDELLAGLQDDMLKAPPKKRFPPPDLT